MPTAMIQHARFKNRTAVGQALAKLLQQRHYEAPVVLALPRGGVPIAVPIAQELGAPVDLVMVRKLGAPDQPELALGAVVDGPDPRMVVNESIRRACGIDDDELAAIERRELREIERRRALYLRGRAPVPLEGRTAIVVDDGVATGATLRVALDDVRRRHAARLVVATGVASRDIIAALATEVDDVICLAEPEILHSVGQYYEDFAPVCDQEVTDLLASIG